MAEEKLNILPEVDFREAEEIERLLKEEEERAKEKVLQTHPLKKYLNVKVLLGSVATFLLIGGMIWVIVSLVERSAQISRVSRMEQKSGRPSTSVLLQVPKPNIYPLEPFFVPIFHKNKETGKFIQLTVHLVLSNRRLHKDVDKVRPFIRQSIYSLLSRKKPKDLAVGGVRLEETLKREIRVDSNSFLISGTGTVTDVVFTEFIISPS